MIFGVLFLWLGYSVGYYGYNRITGGNDHFVDLIYPGRYHPVTRDSGAGGAAAAGASSASSATPPTPKTSTPATKNRPVTTGNVRTAGAT